MPTNLETIMTPEKPDEFGAAAVIPGHWAVLADRMDTLVRGFSKLEGQLEIVVTGQQQASVENGVLKERLETFNATLQRAHSRIDEQQKEIELLKTSDTANRTLWKIIGSSMFVVVASVAWAFSQLNSLNATDGRMKSYYSEQVSDLKQRVRLTEYKLNIEPSVPVKPEPSTP